MAERTFTQGDSRVGVAYPRGKVYRIKLDLHYVDPRLVDLYDIENTRGIDTDFYLQLAADIGAHKILDLGCGTGLLTSELVGEGRHVVGVDPSSEMLAHARQKPNAHLVRWVEGDASALGTPEADLILMTGNVAQVFLDDAEWLTTLRDIHAALRPSGYLAFENRNPDARAWENWNREATYVQIESPYGPVECWLELVSVNNGRVHFEGHNVFNNTGERVVANSILCFRSLAELTDSLVKIGFKVENTYGGWKREPVSNASQVMVFIAQRN